MLLYFLTPLGPLHWEHVNSGKKFILVQKATALCFEVSMYALAPSLSTLHSVIQQRVLVFVSFCELLRTYVQIIQHIFFELNWIQGWRLILCLNPMLNIWIGMVWSTMWIGNLALQKGRRIFFFLLFWIENSFILEHWGNSFTLLGNYFILIFS